MIAFLLTMLLTCQATLKVQLNSDGTTRRPFVQAIYNMTLTNYLDRQYYAPILVGSAQEELQTMFSTGAAESWVTSSVCPSTQCI